MYCSGMFVTDVKAGRGKSWGTCTVCSRRVRLTTRGGLAYRHAPSGAPAPASGSVPTFDELFRGWRNRKARKPSVLRQALASLAPGQVLCIDSITKRKMSPSYRGYVYQMANKIIGKGLYFTTIHSDGKLYLARYPKQAEGAVSE